MQQKIQQAVNFIRAHHAKQPEIGIILGSGLGAFCEQMKESVELSYDSIPHFPISTVSGHSGKLVLGQSNNKNIVIMSGRFHHYEGYSLQQVVFPVRVMAKLGIKTLIVTNAAGGVNESFKPGDLMVIEDHINLLGSNPLIGPNDEKEWGPRFPDMTTAYTPKLRDLIKNIGKESAMELKSGVYLAISGPTYETPAEIRMMRTLGADAVGMSTVPEVIVARQMGLDIVGISCITNMAAGILGQPLSHEEVFEVAGQTTPKFISLLEKTIEKL